MSRVISSVLCAWMLSGCGDRWDDDADPYDLDFEISRSEQFAPALSAYGLYQDQDQDQDQEPSAPLQPAERVFLYELSSELFTDYAYKQRLLRVPEGTSITLSDDVTLEYPEGTVLAKTFYYPLDMRDRDASVRVIETRLLVKTEGLWNAATYLWNDEQTDATLRLDGTTTEVSWIDEAGQSWATDYAVPHEGECVTCHQQDGVSAPIGPTARNLNRAVTRGSNEMNQLAYLRTEGVLADGEWESVPAMPDYRDAQQSLESRARAYLDINCAHCHNPDGWDEAARRDFDLRYTTPLSDTGLPYEAETLAEAMEDGEMPYLGTTLLHEDGIGLVLDYLESL